MAEANFPLFIVQKKRKINIESELNKKVEQTK